MSHVMEHWGLWWSCGPVRELCTSDTQRRDQPLLKKAKTQAVLDVLSWSWPQKTRRTAFGLPGQCWPCHHVLICVRGLVPNIITRLSGKNSSPPHSNYHPLSDTFANKHILRGLSSYVKSRLKYWKSLNDLTLRLMEQQLGSPTLFTLSMQQLLRVIRTFLVSWRIWWATHLRLGHREANEGMYSSQLLLYVATILMWYCRLFIDWGKQLGSRLFR